MLGGPGCGAGDCPGVALRNELGVFRPPPASFLGEASPDPGSLGHPAPRVPRAPCGGRGAAGARARSHTRRLLPAAGVPTRSQPAPSRAQPAPARRSHPHRRPEKQQPTGGAWRATPGRGRPPPTAAGETAGAGDKDRDKEFKIDPCRRARAPATSGRASLSPRKQPTASPIRTAETSPTPEATFVARPPTWPHAPSGADRPLRRPATATPARAAARPRPLGLWARPLAAPPPRRPAPCSAAAPSAVHCGRQPRHAEPALTPGGHPGGGGPEPAS